MKKKDNQYDLNNVIAVTIDTNLFALLNYSSYLCNRLGETHHKNCKVIFLLAFVMHKTYVFLYSNKSDFILFVK